MLSKIHLVRGDITKMEVDAIVNAANSSLLGGGGVDGAIHRAGGPEILNECKKIRAKQGGCDTGEAVMTTAGNLPSKKVIHTVGPIWSEGFEEDNDRLLANCYHNSLALAVSSGLKTIAFPNISTGVYGYPKERAARIAITAVQSYLEEYDNLEAVWFVCFDEGNYKLYKDLLKR